MSKLQRTPFPREADQARVLLEQAASLLVKAAAASRDPNSLRGDIHDDLADLVTLAAWSCTDPPKKKRIKKACWHMRGGHD